MSSSMLRCTSLFRYIVLFVKAKCIMRGSWNGWYKWRGHTEQTKRLTRQIFPNIIHKTTVTFVKRLNFEYRFHHYTLYCCSQLLNIVSVLYMIPFACACYLNVVRAHFNEQTSRIDIISWSEYVSISHEKTGDTMHLYDVSKVDFVPLKQQIVCACCVTLLCVGIFVCVSFKFLFNWSDVESPKLMRNVLASAHRFVNASRIVYLSAIVEHALITWKNRIGNTHHLYHVR